MYESPVLRRMRQATEEAVDDADFAERLIDAIQNDPDVRAAILRLIRATPPSQPAKKTAPAKRAAAARKGRGR